MKNKLCVIFDIDATLSETKHREYLVNSPDVKQRKWNEFFDLMHLDPPIKPTIEMLKRFAAQGLDIILVTGRPYTHREMTEKWLAEHGIFFNKLIMKSKKERILAAPLFKAKVAGQLQDAGYVIKLAVDDEPSVREMYTLIGLKSTPPPEGN